MRTGVLSREMGLPWSLNPGVPPPWGPSRPPTDIASALPRAGTGMAMHTHLTPAQRVAMCPSSGSQAICGAGSFSGWGCPGHCGISPKLRQPKLSPDIQCPCGGEGITLVEKHGSRGGDSQ